MKKIILALLCLVVVRAEAVEEYYSISRSTRALGMGGAFYALSDDDYALFYNPAGLAAYRGTGRFNLLGINLAVAPKVFDAIKTLGGSKNKDIKTVLASLQQYQGTPLYGGVGLNFLSYYRKNFAIGFLVPDTKFNFALLGRDFDSTVDLTAIADGGVLVGFANSFMDDMLHVGLTAKGLVRAGGKRTFTLLDIAQNRDFTLSPDKLGGVGGGIDFDLGGIFQLPIARSGPFLFSRVSLSINNLLASKFDMVKIQGGAPPGLVRQLSIGSHTVLAGWQFIDNFHILLDLAEFSLGGESDPDFGARSGSFFKHLNFGIEAPIAGWFTPRLGFHQGYFTAGFGIDARVIKIDFATYAEELSRGIDRLGSRRVALRVQIGWGGAPPPPILPKDAVSPSKAASPDDKKDQKPPAEVPVLQPESTTETPQATPVDADKSVIQLEDPKANKPDAPKPTPTPEPPTTRPELDQKREELAIPKIEGKSGDRFDVDGLKDKTP